MAKVLGSVVLVLLALSDLRGSDYSKPSDDVSLAVVEALHERLNDESGSAGVVALYQGALAYPLVRGVTPAFYPGRWDIYPLEKVFKDDVFAPHLAKQADAFCSVQITQAPTNESIVLTVNGKKVAISVHGVAKTWCFPRSPGTTVEALLERCSDRPWAEKIAKARRAAGLKTGESKGADRFNKSN